MKRPIKRIEPEFEVTLTFQSAASAKAFASRVMNTRKRKLPFTRDVYRVREIYVERDR